MAWLPIWDCTTSQGTCPSGGGDRVGTAFSVAAAHRLATK